MVLTSERKVRKLFIKFAIWNKFSKADNLLKQYPECDMPWQKALEEASMKNMYCACKWIYNNARLRKIVIDIHFRNNEILATPCKLGYSDDVKFIIKLEPEYPWLENENIREMIEHSPRKEKIMALFN
jgi:hypothetical protein